MVFKNIGKADIDKWNGKFIETKFNSNLYTFGESEFKDWGRYKGMLDK
jgi:hypothetical protein